MVINCITNTTRGQKGLRALYCASKYHVPPTMQGSSFVILEGFNLSVIILASLLVFSMLGCRHSLLRLCNISRFSQVKCTFSNIPTYVYLTVGGFYLVLLALTFRYRVVMKGHLLFVDHFYEKIIEYLTFPLMYPLEMSFCNMLILHSC